MMIGNIYFLPKMRKNFYFPLKLMKIRKTFYSLFGQILTIIILIKTLQKN